MKRVWSRLDYALSASALALLVGALPAQAGTTASTASAAPSAPAITPQATPAWVIPRDIPTATPARLKEAQEGVAFLLSDGQVRVKSQGHDDWFRLASKVVNRSGLESAGQITIEYDPAFETVSINFVHIIRDGKIIDLTPETTFRVVERESDLNEGIISGSLKAIANLRDVRVGDIVDYATTTHTNSLLWPGQFFDAAEQRYSQALALRTLRFVFPADMTVRDKAMNSTIAFTKRRLGDQQEWEWTAADQPAMQNENDVPGSFNPWGRVDISTMSDWAQVVQWALPFYAGDDSLPADVTARLDAIASAHPDPAERLTEIARYVQDNIRYVGEEMGEGSYVPRRPRTVLERGYGDCKDKALLLAVALRHVGIDAVPALVSTRRGLALPERLPSPRLFDHVIVRATLDGKPLWIDATGTHRGGRGTSIVQSDLGYALPLRTGQTELEPMEGYAAHAGGMDVLERFSVDEAGATPLTLHVETRYTEAMADYMRSRVADRSAQTIARNNIDFYRKRFAGLAETKPLELRDDREANTLLMVEDYTLSRDDFVKDKIAAKLTTNAYAVADQLPDRQSGPRQQPLAVPADTMRTHVIEMHVKDRAIWVPEDIDAQSGGIHFSRQTAKLPDGTRMTYRLITDHRWQVPASGAEDIYAVSDKIADETGLNFFLDKSDRPSQTPSAKVLDGFDPARIDTIRDTLVKVADLTKKGDDPSLIQALSLLNGVAATVRTPSPAAGLIDGMKGALLTQLRRPAAALAALQSGVEQYDGNPDVFRILIAQRIDGNDTNAILDALRITLKAQPAVIAKLDESWVKILMRRIRALPVDNRKTTNDDVCIILTTGGWQLDPRSSMGNGMLDCAIAAHVQRGDLDKARAGLAQQPAAETLVRLAIDKRDAALWPDLDKMGRDGFHTALERDVTDAAAAAKQAPTDYKILTRYMRSLRAVGRTAEAIAVGKAMAADRQQIEATGEDAFWFVNDYAISLANTGQTDQAIAALDGLLALGMDNYPSLISIAINRAVMLNHAERHQAALDWLNNLEAHDAAKVSPYGMMWILAEKACALHALGRGGDAKATEAKLAEKPSDNWSAFTQAAACRSDTGTIAEALVTRLNDAGERSSALGLFIRFGGAETLTPYERRLRKALIEAQQAAMVKAAFTQYGRVISYAGTRTGWNDF